MMLARDAVHTRHPPQQVLRRRNPRAGLALPEAAIEDELNVDAADGVRGLEHLRLDVTGAIPGGLPAGARVRREDPAPAPRRSWLRRDRQLTQELGRAPCRARVGQYVVVSGVDVY